MKNKKTVVFSAIVAIGLILFGQIQTYADLPENGETTIVYSPTLSSGKADDSTSSSEKVSSSSSSNNKISIPDKVKNTTRSIVNNYVRFPKTNEIKKNILMFLGIIIVLAIFLVCLKIKKSKDKM